MTYVVLDLSSLKSSLLWLFFVIIIVIIIMDEQLSIHLLSAKYWDAQIIDSKSILVKF